MNKYLCLGSLFAILFFMNPALSQGASENQELKILQAAQEQSSQRFTSPFILNVASPEVALPLQFKVPDLQIALLSQKLDDIELAPLVVEKKVTHQAWYKTWWFWTAVGVVVAGTTVGTYFAVQPSAGGEGSNLFWRPCAGGSSTCEQISY